MSEIDARMAELARDMENLIPTPEKWQEIVDDLNRSNCVDRLVRVGQVPFCVGSSEYVFDLLCERSEDSEASGWVKRVHFRLASETSETSEASDEGFRRADDISF